jgi:hypothetical protein
MKSTADNARDQSFAVDQSKIEFEVYDCIVKDIGENPKQFIIRYITNRQKKKRVFY